MSEVAGSESEDTSFALKGSDLHVTPADDVIKDHVSGEDIETQVKGVVVVCLVLTR